MSLKKWLSFTIFSLLVVAALGVLLRYKITFSLPAINQKFLQHSHSHFAMSGWLTQLLMILLASSVSRTIDLNHFRKYNFVLFANIFASYGMLASFIYQGYGAISISLSTLSVLCTYYFGVQLWRDMNRSPQKLAGYNWFKASIVFAVLSSFGVGMLGYLMATKNVNINIQQATTYFYLHFQYNGWLVFACFGLLLNLLENKGIRINHIDRFFWIYAVACLPAYFLSTLWMHLPLWVYLIVALSALLILGGWLWFYVQLRPHFSRFLSGIPRWGIYLLTLSCLAYTIKVLLQAGSMIPSLNNMAFGYRPIVIGYLHLVFLGVISLFLLGYLVTTGKMIYNRWLTAGFAVFVTGIILNELALMVQGLSAMQYTTVPYINETLFIITVTMFSGALLINLGSHRKTINDK
jgi:hypothetical protein